MSLNRDKGTATPEYSVLWYVSPLQNVQITGSLVAGLHSLAAAGEIELTIRKMPAAVKATRPMVLNVSKQSTNEQRKISFDVSDWSDRFCMDTLQSVDTYYKRNYWPESCIELPEALRTKVRPGALTFGCLVPGTRSRLFRLAGIAYAARLSRPSEFKFAPSLVRYLTELEQIRCFLPNQAWLRSAADAPQSRVVFQTRIWDDLSSPDADRSGINQDRIDLVKALRAEFGSGDTIGLLDTMNVRNDAPNEVLTEKVSRRKYAKQLRTSLISVNSHGLDGSGGFKLAESLAAGSALVSQPLRIQLADPLVSGVHYLPYESPEECVEQCKRLLGDRQLAENMRSTNLKYYHANVSPLAQARNLLADAFQ